MCKQIHMCIVYIYIYMFYLVAPQTLLSVPLPWSHACALTATRQSCSPNYLPMSALIAACVSLKSVSSDDILNLSLCLVIVAALSLSFFASIHCSSVGPASTSLRYMKCRSCARQRRCLRFIGGIMFVLEQKWIWTESGNGNCYLCLSYGS